MQHILLTIIAIMLAIHYADMPVVLTPPTMFVATGLLWFMAVMVLAGWFLNQWSMKEYPRKSMEFGRFLRRQNFYQTVYTVLMYLSYWGVLEISRWSDWLHSFAIVSDWSVLLCGCTLLPFVLFFFIRWSATLPFERLAQDGQWTAAAYLRFRCFALLPLVPMFLMIAAQDVSRFLPPPLVELFTYNTAAVLTLMLLMSVGVISCFPFLLRWFFRCKPLPSGPLRDAFTAILQKSGVRCREILVWPMGGLQVSNAMMTGVLPGWRYVFITDVLLENMPQQALEGVFAHEVGHGYHQHLFFLLMFFSSFTFCSALYFGVGDALYAGVPDMMLGGMVALGILYWAGGFGYLMRRFERQADLYAMRVMGSPWPIMQGLIIIRETAEKHRKLSGFFHFTIEERLRFLAAAHEYPEVQGALDRQARGLQTGVGGGFLLTLALHIPFFSGELRRIQLQELADANSEIPKESYPRALEILQVAVHANQLDVGSRLQLAELRLLMGQQDRNRAAIEAALDELDAANAMTADAELRRIAETTRRRAEHSLELLGGSSSRR